MGGSFIGYEVLYTDQIPTTPIRLGQLLVDESEAAPLDMLKYCSNLSPLTYTSFSDGILPLIPVGANPTASVGLSTVNGSALTFMRSDAAPPLDVGISPTWTGAHTWTGASPLVIGADNKELRFGAGGDDLAIYHDGSNNYIDSNTGSLYLRGDPSTGAALRIVSSANGSTILSGARPRYYTSNDNAGTNEKAWYVGSGVTDSDFEIGTVTDAFGSGQVALRISRSGTTVTTQEFRVVALLRADALATTGALVSGTYTPTLTGTANVDSVTSNGFQYLRVGNTVTVSGSVSLNPTTNAANTTFDISLPITSDFTDAYQAAGVGVEAAGGALVYSIFGNATNNRVTVRTGAVSGTNARNVWVHFTYQII